MAGNAGPSDTDVLQYVATQAVATGSLGPFVLGMLLDVYLGGFALSLFLRYVRSSAWRADGWRLRLLLLSAMALSLIDIGSNYWSTWHYMTSQERAADVLYSQTIVDAFSLVPVGLVGSSRNDSRESPT
ncbi:BQ5605_C001g00782 [Microbotryum silenes-dioicae]|uniref:BQ5605_C001g00782 protein n=1 Tax=Microbotryum silenes-dioicae TaxID=796604 RepID=A0A2X0MRS2_9BASI|nr:BQ5605_C001g00782 [Microbotryum silenes-dioicae]